MRLNRALPFIVLLSCAALPGRSQDNIPIGAWRLHLSYDNILAVEPAPDKVYAASVSGILVYDRSEKTLSAYNKLNGLSHTGITCIRFAPTQNMLLVGYEDGGLDIITPTTVFNFDRLKDAGVTSPKKINDISVHENFAYLATAYGVVVFDLQKLEIKETWRDLGPSGEELFIYTTTFLRDSVYLGTRSGVLAGNLNDNLLDFASWERFNSGDFSGSIRGMTTFAGKVYAGGSSSVFHLGDNTWVTEPLLQFSSIASITASDEKLFLVSDSTIRSMNLSGEVAEVTDPLIVAPVVVRQDQDGNLWIGDQHAGLVSDIGGAFSSYIPNGPSPSHVSRMETYDGKLYAVSGGFAPSGEPLKIPGVIDVFENGAWRTDLRPFSDITDVAFVNGDRYVSTFGSGIEKRDVNGNVTMFDQTNSPLTNADLTVSTITALAPSADGLWVANAGGAEPLHLLKADGTWESFSFGFPNEEYPIALSVGDDGSVWIVLNPETGGGLIAYNRNSGKAYYKTNVAGSGGLPDMKVRCVATDKDGYTWVGTDAGVAYFYSATEDAIKPIYESRFLLRDEKITSIEVDGGNRKWMGTDQGVWLFNTTGESLVRHFTAENSPLLTGSVEDIEINGETGEVFFATGRGIISYRGDAVEGRAAFGTLRIFPNPVPPGYSGTVGITGLSENAVVKITDISGKLVWETRANGGMATWNARAEDGRPAPTGIYLVFASTEDGGESVVGKIAVIE